MEKSTKWALRIIEGAAILGIGLYAIKAYRSKNNALKQQASETKKAVENAGTTEEILKKEVSPESEEPGAYIKSICVGTVYNNNFEVDVVDSELAFKSEHVIYVRDNETDFGKNIEFLLRIPHDSLKKGNFGVPSIGNFKTSAKNAADHVWKEIIKNSPEAKVSIMGILYYNEGCDDEEITRGIEITENMYQEYMDEKYPLNAFVEFINKRLDEIDDENVLRPNETILKALGKTEEDYITIKDAILCVKISFPVMFWSKKHSSFIGVNVPMAIECLNYLINEFEVSRLDADGNPVRSTEKTFTYDHVIFLGTMGEGNLARYWDVEVEDGEVKELTKENIYM